MRWLALLLLAGNVAFLGWALRAPPVVPEVSMASQPSRTPRLVLLAELPADKMPASRKPLVPGELPAGIETPADLEGFTAEAERQPVTAPTAPDCYRLSGFADMKSASEAKAALEKGGAVITGPQAEQVTRIRYWVLLPPSPSRDKALAVVERLKRAGVKDYYLIPNGENQNAVSLGVFSSREAANRRVDDVAGLRLKVRVEEVKYSARHFVLESRWIGAEVNGWKNALPRGVDITAKACGHPVDQR